MSPQSSNKRLFGIAALGLLLAALAVWLVLDRPRPDRARGNEAELAGSNSAAPANRHGKEANASRRTNKSEPENRPVNQPTNSSDGKVPGEDPPQNPPPKKPTQPLKWMPRSVSWDPEKSLVPEGILPDVSAPARTSVDQPENPTDPNKMPENTLYLEVEALDAVSGKKLAPVRIEVVDDTGRLRVAATISGDKRLMRGGRVFLLKYEGPRTFLLRAQHEDKVGFAVFGTGPGGYVSTHTGTLAIDEGPGNRARFKVRVLLSSQSDREVNRTSVRVLDGANRPLEGATILLHAELLALTDASGIASFAMPNLSSADHEVLSYWTGPLTVHYPGKVPVFVPVNEFVPGGNLDLVLRADEFVLEFALKLPNGALPEHPRLGGEFSRYVDRGIFDARCNPKEVLAQLHWEIERLHYHTGGTTYTTDNMVALVAATGRPAQESEIGVHNYYDYWYAGQWKYNDETTKWHVVIPHRGRFVIAINLQKRDDRHPGGDLAPFIMMYPGLYIDATDPENPKAELIYPP